jgi:hypothetical protein
MNSRQRLTLASAGGLAFVVAATGVSWGNAVFLPVIGLLVFFLAIFLYSVKKGLGGVYSICLGQPPVILLSMVDPFLSLAGELTVIGLGVGIEVRTWSRGERYLLLVFMLAAGGIGTALLLPAHVGLLPPIVLVLAAGGAGLLILNEQRINLRFKGRDDESKRIQ